MKRWAMVGLLCGAVVVLMGFLGARGSGAEGMPQAFADETVVTVDHEVDDWRGPSLNDFYRDLDRQN